MSRPFNRRGYRVSAHESGSRRPRRRAAALLAALIAAVLGGPIAATSPVSAASYDPAKLIRTR